MVSVKHKFSSTKADVADASQIKPSHWNAEHDLVASSSGIVLGRLAADGPGPVQELPIMAFLPAGVVMAWAGNTLSPGGWYICDGTVRPVEDDPVLYSVIGNTYGGVAPLTFAVPDLRGRVIAGPNAGADRLGAPWMTPNGDMMGATGGEQSTTLTIKQVPSHTHVATVTDPSHDHTDILPQGAFTGGGVGGYATGGVLGDISPTITTNTNTTGITVAIANTGGDPDAEPANATAPVSNLQPTLIMQYLIKR